MPRWTRSFLRSVCISEIETEEPVFGETQAPPDNIMARVGMPPKTPPISAPFITPVKNWSVVVTMPRKTSDINAPNSAAFVSKVLVPPPRLVDATAVYDWCQRTYLEVKLFA